MFESITCREIKTLMNQIDCMKEGGLFDSLLPTPFQVNKQIGIRL